MRVDDQVMRSFPTYAVLRVQPGNEAGRKSYPGVHGAVEPLRSISNSAVKRCSADDIWGVAP
jgi:hypothetical protein